MKPDEFQERVKAAGFSIHGFAHYAETNVRTVRRWVDGEQDIPGWVGVMLGLIEDARMRPRATPPAAEHRVPPFPKRLIAATLEDDPI